MIAVILALIIIRIALPYIVLKYANKELAAMDGYYGHVQDIDIHLYRGAYVLDSIYINKLDTVKNRQSPFMGAKTIDLSVEWKSLFDGRIVGELGFQDPFLKFVRNSTELAQVQKDTADFLAILNAFMPLQINRFDINRGRIIYIDSTTQPKVNVEMNEVYVTALNLKSVKDTAILPATVNASSKVYKGHLTLNMKLDPLADQPLFDMNVNLEDTHLPELNDFFKAYASLDVHKGSFGMYSEVASKNGAFKGYVKPIIKDLDIKGPEDKDDNFMNKVLENIVSVFGKILENPKADQVATKIPFEGTFEKTDAGLWATVVELLRNAFITALYPSIDNQINLSSLNKEEEEKKGIIKRIFGGKDKKK